MNGVETSVLEIEAADVHGTEIEPTLGERQGRRCSKAGEICPIVNTLADNLARRPKRPRFPDVLPIPGGVEAESPAISELVIDTCDASPRCVEHHAHRRVRATA